MQLTVKGKQIDVGQSLRTYVTEHLNTITEKYFNRSVDASVIFSQDAHLFKADISVHVGRGILLQSSAEATEVYPAFDAAAEKVTTRLKRYKDRLKDHHPREVANSEMASQYIINDNEADADAATQKDPAIIAELQTHIGVMTVAEAVMYMDLADLPAYMFRNSAHNGLNMVYRRSDGNVGWVDPRGNLNA